MFFVFKLFKGARAPAAWASLAGAVALAAWAVTGHVARRSVGPWVRGGWFVLSLIVALGAGVAAQTGYKLAVREGYACVVQLDADGQHEPGDIPKLLAVIQRGDADVAIGSRFLDGATTYRPGVLRRVGMGLFGLLAWLLTGVRFSDVTSGFRAFSGDVVRFVATEWYPTDYADADVLITLRRAGFRLRDVPVRMYERAGGRSMHAGLKPVYYVFKMLLSVALAPVRREAVERKGS